MVQAEFDQDYHAALELPSTATPNDIEKQFKKLGMSGASVNGCPRPLLIILLSVALQYHPDRNPDKDTTAKF